MLTERQVALLNAIIREHVESSEPVGSVEIVSKYSFKCSPATIRNEMAKLIEMGYLEMFHTSSGRIPTKTAYKLYLSEILEETDLPVLQEVALKQRLWPMRYNMVRMLREATVALSEMTKLLSIATTDDGFLTSAGTVNVLDSREFWEIEVAKSALLLLDNYELLEKIFKKVPSGDEVRVLIGDEIEIEHLDRCAFVFTPFRVGDQSGFIALFGPARLHYDAVMPALRYTKRLIEELGESW